MPYLCVFKIFLVGDSSAFRNLSHKGSEFLIYDVFDFFIVLSFNLVSVSLLVVNKVVNFISFWHSRNKVGLFNLHIIENPVDVHISRLKVRSSLDEGLGQLLTCLLVGSVSDVALPEAENFADKVMFKEFHGSQNVKHGALLHPVRKTQEFSRRGCVCALFATFFVENLDNTLS